MRFKHDIIYTLFHFIFSRIIRNFNEKESFKDAKFVDPLPQAMILTSIVIGLATTAVLLAVAIRLHKKYGTFNIDEIKSLRG